MTDRAEEVRVIFGRRYCKLQKCDGLWRESVIIGDLHALYLPFDMATLA